MRLITLYLVLLLAACSSDESHSTAQMYFPPLNSEEWQTITITDLGWNEDQLQPLLDYLIEKNTKSFIILVDGKIVVEEYMNGHTMSSPWYWASAGKTLTATMVGIAEQENFLGINDKVSDHLGTAWTSAPIAKENLITVKHLLSMTSGLDDTLGDNISAANLVYIADAGTRWAYHNVYVKLQDVVAQSVGQSWTNYFNEKLRDRIGMTGSWIETGDDLSVYLSNSRSMARFGLLMLNKGKWQDEVVLNESYFSESTNVSQSINQSYGYLWWLNGKPGYMLPQTQFQFSGSLIDTAPGDMFMALGKNDQKIYVVPSKRMVVIRMGDAADNVNLALSDFDQQLWLRINALYQ